MSHIVLKRRCSWGDTQVDLQDCYTKFPKHEEANIIVSCHLTECDCQAIKWCQWLAIPVNGFISLEIQFVMSIITAPFWVTGRIAARGIAWCCHASVCLQWTTVGYWMLLHSLLLKCVFFLLYVFLFSCLTFMHHAMASLWLCMPPSAVCKYSSAHFVLS